MATLIDTESLTQSLTWRMIVISDTDSDSHLARVNIS